MLLLLCIPTILQHLQRHGANIEAACLITAQLLNRRSCDLPEGAKAEVLLSH